MKNFWNHLLNWLENGDLVPWVILVSIPHYFDVLKEFDYWYASLAFAILVDLGHYRTIKLFVRRKAIRGGTFWWMTALTIVSLGFHIAFYVISGAKTIYAVMLGLVVPILIFALAYLSGREGWGATAKKEAASSGEKNRHDAATTGDKPANDWRLLTPKEKAEIAAMSPTQVSALYQIADRTARQWVQRAAAGVRPAGTQPGLIQGQGDREGGTNDRT